MPNNTESEDDSDDQLVPTEPYISRDDLDMVIAVGEDNHSVYVVFAGFSDIESAEAYATSLAENLPLLLFGSTRMH